MLYFHYFIWLCGVFHLSEIHNPVCLDLVYIAGIVEFIENIIRYSIVSRLQAETLSQKAPQASLDETDDDYGSKLEHDSNAVAAKSQFHSNTYNTTCFKYGAAASRQYWFDFLRP